MASRLNSSSTASMSASPVSNNMVKNSSNGSNSHKSNNNVIKRLQSELMTLMTSPTPGITAFPAGTNMTSWTATLLGPTGTPYSGLTLKLTLNFPDTYPYAPPDVRFATPIYHPNVDMAGRICLDILKPATGNNGGAAGGGEGGAWSAVLNTGAVLLSIQSLLGEPNNASPLNGEAAVLWDRDQVEFKKKVLARHQEPEELDNGL